MATGYIMLDSPNPTTAQGTYPRRGVFGKLSGTCIVHTSEGDWRAGVDSLTGLVRRRSDYGCYHRACDWADIALYYPWEWEAWQDSETNNWAVGIAAACRTSDWRVMPAEILEGYYRNMARMAADFVAYMRDEYGVEVPLRRLSGAEARARVPGFCAHGDSGVARSDPGADFDWNKFFDYTRQALGGVLPQGEIITKNEEDDDKMLIIARKKGEDAVWVGDGVTRRWVPNERALSDLVWFAENGFLKIKNNGQVFDFDEIDGLGVDVVNAVAGETLNRPVPWYGFGGVQPAEGRQTTTLALQTGWFDTQFSAGYDLVRGVNTAVGSVLEALKETPGIDGSVIEGLKEQLEAKLKEATDNLRVTLEVKPAEEVVTDGAA